MPSATVRRDSPDVRLALLRDTLLGLSRQDRPELTTRQLITLMVVYGSEERHTVASLSTLLNIPRPAITRTMDSLVRSGLMSRGGSAAARRDVIALRTIPGAAFYREVAALAQQAAASARIRRPPSALLN